MLCAKRMTWIVLAAVSFAGKSCGDEGRSGSDLDAGNDTDTDTDADTDTDSDIDTETPQDYAWHTFYGSESDDFGYSVTVDPDGNHYVVGVSEQTGWEGPGGESPIHEHSGTEGGQDTFVLKLGSDGAYLWHTFFPGEGMSIARDPSGSIYVAGASDSTWEGPGGEPPLQPYLEDYDLVVLKLDADGNYQWHTFYGSLSVDGGTSTIVDTVGDIYIAGLASGTWNGPEGETPLHEFTGNHDLVVLKLSGNGDYQWHTFYPMGNEVPSVAIDVSGNLYATGQSIDPWYGPSGESPLNPYVGSSSEMTIVKLGSDGTYDWHAFYGSADGYDYGNAIGIGASGNVFLTGQSELPWTGPAGENPIYPYSGDEGNPFRFQLALGSDGTYLWHSFCGEGATALAIDEEGDLLLTGGSENWLGPDGESPLESAANFDIVVLKLGSDGSYKWHTFYGGGATDRGVSITISESGGISIAGQSTGGWYGPNYETPLHEYSANYDLFVLKLAP